ncbi:WD40 repeat domain-containing protein [Leptolyngbya sp. Heron Island J]|uniref:WD40 repeat domain-containing protein n=1 Tax=Leptolyngbya sp. Heron Island J TaxID=1385935 RepID=UPI003FA3B62E
MVQILKGHVCVVWPLNASPTENLLVSGSLDASLFVWDVATYKLHRRLNGHTQQINSVAFSPDGKQIVNASVDKTLRI